MQLHRVWVERQSLSENAKRFIILAFIVKLMGALVVLFRTKERSGHREQASSSEGCYLPIVPGASAKFNGNCRCRIWVLLDAQLVRFRSTPSMSNAPVLPSVF